MSVMTKPQTHKKCSFCGETLPVSEFLISGKTVLGFPRYRSRCRGCLRDYRKNIKKMTKNKTIICDSCKIEKSFLHFDRQHRQKFNGDMVLCKKCADEKELEYIRNAYKQYEVIRTETGKTCVECGEIKPFDQFLEHKFTEDNLTDKCNKCITVEAKAARGIYGKDLRPIGSLS